jgi:O-antigen ligase
LRTPLDFAFGLGTGAIGGSVVYGGDRAGPFAYNAVDNYYLLILVNHGVLGVVIWGAFALQLFWLCLRGSMIPAEVDWFLNGVVAMLIMDLGASLFRMLLAVPAESAVFWVFAGMAAVRAQELIKKRSKRISRSPLLVHGV